MTVSRFLSLSMENSLESIINPLFVFLILLGLNVNRVTERIVTGDYKSKESNYRKNSFPNAIGKLQ